MKKQIELVMGLCQLHNFVITNGETKEEFCNIPQFSAQDLLYSSSHGGGVPISEDGCLVSLLDEYVDPSEHQYVPRGSDLIRQNMKCFVEENGLQSPLPSGT